MRPSYTDILFRLLADWPEQRYSVKALAARFYVGADTEDDLIRLSQPLHGWSGKPPISGSEVHAVISARASYVA